MSKVKFYHAGCPVCVSAEQAMLDAIKYDVEVIHLGEKKDLIDQAAAEGVKSVPALVLNGQPYHINFGASLDDVRNS
ncbi:MAG: thioredoxin family protein [Candidatus Omnitrophica bacterium]|nr:thioredoxin family protein [Candidatus Omnitrophota bacterium]